MGAYAAVVSLMNDLELIQNHPRHSFSFDNKQITSLSQTVHFLVDFMESYHSHGCSREAVEALESRITFAAHAAHDVIESHVVNQIHSGSTLGGKARSYFLLDLQKAIDNMDFVNRKAMQFKAKSGLKAEQPTYSAATSSEPLTSGKNIMVGFDAVRDQLMHILTGEPSRQRVIPIVGMGGMGKTTLARNVYEHLYIQQHFDVLRWATISHEYSVETILTELLFGKRISTTGGNVNRLGEQLRKNLWGRRYLVILDDLWSMEAWEEIQMFLPDNVNGSCVIVTTRLSNLAAHLHPSPFEMNFLDEDKSWQLFCGMTFGEEDCPSELEEIGKEIVERCEGLPLSIVVIGGHLRKSSREIEYWEKIANYMNPISSLEEVEQCLNIISLSYHHLPVCLKPCFLFMGIYPEDGWIDASKLLLYWVAEGFIKPKKGQSLEEVAEDYLKDLIDRNLILVRERRWNGKAKRCFIHDIVRELCLKVAKKEKFLCVLDDTSTTQAMDRERRIAIPWRKHNSDIVGVLELAPPLLRSLTRPLPWMEEELSADFRLLRLSANVNNIPLKKDARCFPFADFQQLNLRYLSFCCWRPITKIRLTEMPYLPSSISLFWNLQTLIIHNYAAPIAAPYEIWEMPQLRHLEIHHFYLPDPSDRSDQQECIVLRYLHTLLRVEGLRLTEEVSKRMPNIKELHLFYTDFPGDNCEASSYYCPHNLGRFNKLESLTLLFGDDSRWRDFSLSFTFPTSLQELAVVAPHLHWEDLTMMVKSLHHLRSLQLVEVKGSEWNLDEEEFPSLKTLIISRCNDLIYWNADSSHFPVLEYLHIYAVPKLSEIPFDIGDIPTLRRIKLDVCSVSAAISAMKIVVEQECLDNQDLKLHVRFLEREEVEIFQKMMQEEDLRSNSLRL